MSGSIGPCTYLPGQTIPFKADGTCCDECADEAEHRLITEADSMGAEFADLCTYHFAATIDAMHASRAELKSCGICGNVSADVVPTRDPEEGQSGPVYDACPSCRHTLLSCPDEDDEELPCICEEDAPVIGIDLEPEDDEDD